MSQNRIAVIVGSLRKESYNRRMANNIISLAESKMKMDILEIGDLQLYNQDLDETPPGTWTEFRSCLKKYDGVLFVTPEYNRSMSGVLKNAIDVGSRPYGQSVWDGKPAGVISVSVGSTGAFGANHHLRQALVFLNMPCLQQPEMYIGKASELFEVDGKLKSESTIKFVRTFIEAFAAWVDLHATKEHESKVAV